MAVAEKEAIRRSLDIHEENVLRFTGIDFSCTDGGDDPPVETQLNRTNALDWFSSYPENISCPAIRLLVFEMKPGAARNGFDIPFSHEIIEHALWGSEVYSDLTKTPSGGCAALLDNPYRYILQTPLDRHPFVSLAMSRRGILCKGIYVYDHPDFEPTQMMVGEVVNSGWRSEGTQIVNIPLAILKTNSASLSRRLAHILAQIEEVEEVLAHPFVGDFSPLQRTLHLSHDALFALERRSGFEVLVIESIESIVSKARYAIHPWPALAPAKAALKIRRADLETMPRRIENARAAINDSIFQRTQLQSLQIAEATQRMAEATMNDSAAMKTIAILTMIFLPGTAVASFFSMTMWNWQSPTNEGLVSPWLWLYFVVATPLTLAVIATWWFWMRLRTRQFKAHPPSVMNHGPPSFRTMEGGSHKFD